MKAALVLCFVFLFVSSSFSQCILNNPVSAFVSADASCSSSSGCQLSVNLITSLTSAVECLVSALLEGVNLVIAPSGSGTLNIQLSTTGIVYTSLNITANPGVTIQAIGSILVVNVAQNLYLFGNAVLNVAESAVVSVANSVVVDAEATLNVAGNVTASTAISVYGTIYLAGTKVDSAAQTAWVVLKNTASSISISGTASASAYIRGNGGFDGSITLSQNATIAAGNSPGTVFVNGDMNMDSTTTLEIDVDSITDFDRLIISGAFKRNGILYAHFENNYVPSNKDTFIFATHSSASGSFSVYHGNYFDSTVNAVKPKYSSVSTSFQFSSATSVAASLFVILVCALLAL